MGIRSRLLGAIVVAALFVPAAWAGILPDDVIVIRGDADSSGAVNSADGARISNWLFNGGDAPPCLNQADVNDDGSVSVADVSYLMNWLFQGGPAPPAPGPFGSICVEDAAPRPGCESPPSC